MNPPEYGPFYFDEHFGQRDIVPVEVPNESLPIEFIKMKEVPSVVKEFVNIGSDFFVFIIVFGSILIGVIIYRNYKHVGNKTSGKLN